MFFVAPSTFVGFTHTFLKIQNMYNGGGTMSVHQVGFTAISDAGYKIWATLNFIKIMIRL